MTNLDRLCQGGPEGEKYPKTTKTGKATKKQKKEVWKSLVRASSSTQPTKEKKEEEDNEGDENATADDYDIVKEVILYFMTFLKILMIATTIR